MNSALSAAPRRVVTATRSIASINRSDCYRLDGFDRAYGGLRGKAGILSGPLQDGGEGLGQGSGACYKKGLRVVLHQAGYAIDQKTRPRADGGFQGGGSMGGCYSSRSNRLMRRTTSSAGRNTRSSS